MKGFKLKYEYKSLSENHIQLQDNNGFIVDMVCFFFIMVERKISHSTVCPIKNIISYKLNK